MWRLPGELMVRGDGGSLRGEGEAVPGAGHAGGVRPQVRRGAFAWPHIRGLAHQGPSVLQVHAPGRQIRCRRYQVKELSNTASVEASRASCH